jgi:hypothetical protein
MVLILGIGAVALVTLSIYKRFFVVSDSLLSRIRR